MHRLFSSISGLGLSIVILNLSASSAVAQDCQGQWLPGEGLPGVGGTVYAATSWDPDGAGPLNELLVVGGSFNVAGTNLASNIASWNGSTWQPLGDGTNGTVRALAVWNGELIAGGEFATAGGATVNCIARWNGSTWQPLGDGTDGSVLSLTVYNSELIAGGSFTTAGGVNANRIARWNGSAWHRWVREQTATSVP